MINGFWLWFPGIGRLVYCLICYVTCPLYRILRSLPTLFQYKMYDHITLAYWVHSIQYKLDPCQSHHLMFSHMDATLCKKPKYHYLFLHMHRQLWRINLNRNWVNRFQFFEMVRYSSGQRGQTVNLLRKLRRFESFSHHGKKASYFSLLFLFL